MAKAILETFTYLCWHIRYEFYSRFSSRSPFTRNAEWGENSQPFSSVFYSLKLLYVFDGLCLYASSLYNRLTNNVFTLLMQSCGDLNKRIALYYHTFLLETLFYIKTTLMYYSTHTGRRKCTSIKGTFALKNR